MQVAYLLYDRFTALDITGPHEVLGSLPDASSVFVAEHAGPVRNESGSMAILADATLDEVTDPDVLVVPGGFGTRSLLGHEPLLSWLCTVHQSTTWTTSVCTGSLLLATAGILDGQPAATHWLARSRLASLGVTPATERVVRQGKIITAAGVSAGIDMALRLVQLMYGDRVAQAIQLAIEYDPDPPFDAGAPEKAPPEIVAGVKGVFDSLDAKAMEPRPAPPSAHAATSTAARRARAAFK